MSEAEIGTDIAAAQKNREADCIGRGVSGGISVQIGDEMLTAHKSETRNFVIPEKMAKKTLSDVDANWEEPNRFSSERRFHHAVLRQRRDIHAVVHTRGPWFTVLSYARKPIPAILYTIAAFGGPDTRVAENPRYGAAERSGHVRHAMVDRNRCLLAKYRSVVGGNDLTLALWLAREIKALVHQYCYMLAISAGHALNGTYIEERARFFEGHGVRPWETP